MSPTLPLTPLQALRKYWWIGFILVIAGGFGAFFFARSRPVTYTAEARLAVGSSNLKDYAVPGFPLAAQDLAANYARYVGSSQALEALTTSLTAATRAAITGASASPIPSSNIISVEVTATNEQAATAGADGAAAVLIKAVGNGSASNDAQVAALLNAYQQADQKAVAAQVAQAEAQKRVDKSISPGGLASAQQDLITDQLAYNAAQLQATAAGTIYTDALTNPPVASGVSPLGTAAIVSDDQRSTEERDVVIGAGAGLLLSILIATLIGRVAGRRQRITDDWDLDDSGTGSSIGAKHARSTPAAALPPPAHPFDPLEQREDASALVSGPPAQP